MTVHSKVGDLLARVASAVSANRSGDEDERRRELHGCHESEVFGRLSAVVPRLEAVADRLEEELARS